MKNIKYGIRQFENDFGTDDKCLDFLFQSLHSKKCSCGGEYKKLTGRKQYQCSKCRFQIAPTAGTIFHKSDTHLRLWFLAIFLFSNAKSGYSAKQLERDLAVTYKTAWRILNLIRKSLKQNKSFLSGDVEMDETYFGGRFRSGENNKRQKEAVAAKSVIIGAVERKGDLRAKVSPHTKATAIGRFLNENVNPITTRLFTDESNRYDRVAIGYDRHSVNHKSKEYVRGLAHINRIESFWSHFKRSVKGTHKVISKKHLQSYVDSFVFHYNKRHSDKERFSSLLGVLLLASK
jgi:hypothetical protein